MNDIVVFKNPSKKEEVLKTMQDGLKICRNKAAHVIGDDCTGFMLMYLSLQNTFYNVDDENKNDNDDENKNNDDSNRKVLPHRLKTTQIRQYICNDAIIAFLQNVKRQITIATDLEYGIAYELQCGHLRLRTDFDRLSKMNEEGMSKFFKLLNNLLIIIYINNS